jgi:hypothetical protein
MANMTAKVEIDHADIDVKIEKVKQLIALLQEARQLAKELVGELDS